MNNGVGWGMSKCEIEWSSGDRNGVSVIVDGGANAIG